MSFLIAARRCDINDLEQLTRTSALVNATGRLVHALQKERGIANVVLSSQGVRFGAACHHRRGAERGPAASARPGGPGRKRRLTALPKAVIDFLYTRQGHVEKVA